MAKNVTKVSNRGRQVITHAKPNRNQPDRTAYLLHFRSEPASTKTLKQIIKQNHLSANARIRAMWNCLLKPFPGQLTQGRSNGRDPLPITLPKEQNFECGNWMIKLTNNLIDVHSIGSYYIAQPFLDYNLIIFDLVRALCTSTSNKRKNLTWPVTWGHLLLSGTAGGSTTERCWAGCGWTTSTATRRGSPAVADGIEMERWITWAERDWNGSSVVRWRSPARSMELAGTEGMLSPTRSPVVDGGLLEVLTVEIKPSLGWTKSTAVARRGSPVVGGGLRYSQLETNLFWAGPSRQPFD